MSANDVLLVLAVIAAGAEAVLHKSLLAASVAFFAAAFLVR
jgi:hypothetical protein